MKEMALKRTLISKIFWGNLLEAHALGAPTCIISSFRAKKCLPVFLHKGYMSEPFHLSTILIKYL